MINFTMKNFFLTQIYKKETRGFTLIETLVATFIITLVILGPLTVAINASTYARQTRSVITGTYLAEESIELLRHQQYSVYLRCLQAQGSACRLLPGESPRQGAWRIFKERLASNAQGESCFTSENVNGCSYDMIDLIGNEDNQFRKYSSTNSACNTLALTQEYMYVCSSIHGSAGDTPTIFARSVNIVSLPTFAGVDQQYNDDLRITSKVTFTKPNGYIRNVTVIDFFHARQ